jgi:CheY-like chemotaxis protein/two-component sensor histidine kinase
MLRAGAMRPDVQARAIESIERNAHAQSQLVEDLLDVSRIISGKLQLKSGAVDLAHVIAGAVDATRPGATAKGLTMEVDVDTRTQALVTGDADRLQQVVWNLLSNATKFTPAGGRVRIALGAAGSHARIVVSDTGQGISPAFLPHIFERFRQEDGTLARRHTGLGLGLSIVRHLTEAHGGTITAESEGEDRGSTFVILLPVRELRRSHPPGTDRQASDTRLTVRGIGVLVVDDDADARELVRIVLETAGAKVTLSESASEALALMERDRFDVMIADIGMPSQDGYWLIRAVRAMPAERGGRIRAIAVTAYAATRDRDRALQAGFDRHLAKPFDLDELTAQVADVCQNARTD